MEYLYFKLYEDSNLYCITFWILCYAVIISLLFLWDSEVSNRYGISTGKRQSLRQERKSHLSLASASQIFNLKITLLPTGQKSDQPYI